MPACNPLSSEIVHQRYCSQALGVTSGFAEPGEGQ